MPDLIRHPESKKRIKYLDSPIKSGNDGWDGFPGSFNPLAALRLSKGRQREYDYQYALKLFS